MHIEQVKRATGRTTRMLQDAIAHRKAGEQVVVLAHSQDYARQLRFQLRSMAALDIPVDSYNSYRNNPAVMGLYKDHKLFVDHSVAERWYPEVLNEWIKYDEPTPRPNWVVDGSVPKEVGMYLITLQVDGRRVTQVTHWHSHGGWLTPQGKQWIIAWAPMPAPFGEMTP